MKKTGFVFLAFATLALSACMNNKGGTTKAEVTKDTLTYTYKQVKERDADCGSKPDSNCKTLTIKYPLFQKNEQLNKAIKQEIKESYLFEDYYNIPLTKIVSESLKSSHNSIANNIISGLKVMRQDSNLITLQLNNQFKVYSQAFNFISFINWDTKSNRKIILDDVFNPGYKQQLTAIAEKIFRKEENLKDTSSLARDYFFKGAKFALNDNFLLTPTGIRFLYNPKEIKPVEAGTTDLYIPYAQIKTLLKPNTVLAQYIQH